MRCVEWMVRGALAGAVVGIGCEIARQFGWTLHPVVSWSLVAASAMIAGAVAWLWPVSWLSIAKLVDSHYGKKDSASSALDFAARKNVDPLMKLQIEQSITWLKTIYPQQVLPWRVPKFLALAISAIALMLALPFFPQQQLRAPENNPAVQQIANEQARELDETLVAALRELAEASAEPELRELADEIEKLVDAMKRPEVDEREALANLSEMQQSLAATLNQFNAEKTKAELKKLAEALAATEATQAISESLDKSDFEQAASLLEKMDASAMSPKERDALAEGLKQVPENAESNKGSEVAESAKLMREGLEKNDEAAFNAGQNMAASAAKNQGLKNKIANELNKQLNRLSESKSPFQAQAAGGAVQKSTRDSNKVGTAASNKPFGAEAAKLDSTRRNENLTGVQGEGSSERETMQADQGEQDAALRYEKRYTEFRKQMEEVIDSEPLPLGHRATVRKYFESIHPTNQDASE